MKMRAQIKTYNLERAVRAKDYKTNGFKTRAGCTSLHPYLFPYFLSFSPRFFFYSLSFRFFSKCFKTWSYNSLSDLPQLLAKVTDKYHPPSHLYRKQGSWYSLGGRGILSAHSAARTVSAFVDKNVFRPNFPAFNSSEYEILRERLILTRTSSSLILKCIYP